MCHTFIHKTKCQVNTKQILRHACWTWHLGQGMGRVEGECSFEFVRLPIIDLPFHSMVERWVQVLLVHIMVQRPKNYKSTDSFLDITFVPTPWSSVLQIWRGYDQPTNEKCRKLQELFIWDVENLEHLRWDPIKLCPSAMLHKSAQMYIWVGSLLPLSLKNFTSKFSRSSNIYIVSLINLICQVGLLCKHALSTR